MCHTGEVIQVIQVIQVRVLTIDKSMSYVNSSGYIPIDHVDNICCMVVLFHVAGKMSCYIPFLLLRKQVDSVLM